MNYRREDVVGVVTKKGPVDCAVVNVRYISRGRAVGQAEYKLAPLSGKQGTAFGFTAIGEKYLRVASQSWTPEQIRDAISAYEGTKTEVQGRREECREERQNKLSQISPRVGDDVLLKYRDGSRWKRVEAINEMTGKVGIAAAGYERKLSAAMNARRIASMVGDEGTHIREPRKYRWIDPKHIVDVRRSEEG